MITSQRSVAEFWADVKLTAKEIIAAVEKSKLQPKDGTCYVVAVRRKGQKVEFGQIMTATINVAATRIQEGTVELARDNQIADFLEFEDEKAKLRRDQYILARTSYVASPPPVENQAKPNPKNKQAPDDPKVADPDK